MRPRLVLAIGVLVARAPPAAAALVARAPPAAGIAPASSGGRSTKRVLRPAMKLGASDRMKLYDADGDGTITDDELTAWIEDALDRVTSDAATDAMILPFKADPAWLWRRWRGTVFEITAGPIARNTALGVGAFAACSYLAASSAQSADPAVWDVFHLSTPETWDIFAVPDKDNAVVRKLTELSTAWNYLASLATFILTFFLGQTYGYWRKCIELCRGIQGRLMDINLLVASYAARDSDGILTPEARRLIDDTSRNCKLIHALFWSGFETSLTCLHSDKALERLVEVGLLTTAERALLAESGMPSGGRPSLVLAWVMGRVAVGARDGVLIGGAGWEDTFTKTGLALGGTCGSMYDERDGRMPLAYMHIVQIMIDTLCFTAPLALYPATGILCVPLSASLTLFYRGLLELSKSFLDPYGNDGSKAQNVQVDVFIAETNAGVNRLASIERVP